MREVTILGGGESIKYCPYDTKEIWTCNRVYKKAKRVTKLFWMHGFKFDEDVDFQVITKKTYPYKAIIEKFGDYFTDSVCYILAYALYKGYKKIKLYGVEMNLKRHQEERPGVEFWLGVAKGMGIQIEIGEGSCLMKR